MSRALAAGRSTLSQTSVNIEDGEMGVFLILRGGPASDAAPGGQARAVGAP